MPETVLQQVHHKISSTQQSKKEPEWIISSDHKFQTQIYQCQQNKTNRNQTNRKYHFYQSQLAELVLLVCLFNLHCPCFRILTCSLKSLLKKLTCFGTWTVKENINCLFLVELFLLLSFLMYNLHLQMTYYSWTPLIRSHTKSSYSGLRKGVVLLKWFTNMETGCKRFHKKLS